MKSFKLYTYIYIQKNKIFTTELTMKKKGIQMTIIDNIFDSSNCFYIFTVIINDKKKKKMLTSSEVFRISFSTNLTFDISIFSWSKTRNAEFFASTALADNYVLKHTSMHNLMATVRLQNVQFYIYFYFIVAEGDKRSI